LAGWPAQLAAIAFRSACQSPCHRAYCYAELAVLFPSGSHNHR